MGHLTAAAPHRQIMAVSGAVHGGSTVPRFQGKPPGSGAGEMSPRTERLRPHVALLPAQVAHARRMRRAGHEPEQIAEALCAGLEEVEKALMQMRSPRPETTRGTLNVTLAAHKVFLAERLGNEPLWQTVDRVVDELLRLRADAAGGTADRPARRRVAPAKGRQQLSLLPEF